MAYAYVVPQVAVHQEFETIPEAVVSPLRAFIFGPNYKLHRYSVAAEKAAIGLGALDYTVDMTYAWPGRSAGELVDQDWTKLFIDDAWCKYLSRNTADDINRSTLYYNKIRWGTLPDDTLPAHDKSITTGSKAAYPLSSIFQSRGVQVGDGVRVRKDLGGGSWYEKWTYVTAFEADTVPSSIGSTDLDDSNFSVSGGTPVDITSSSATVTGVVQTGALQDTDFTIGHANYMGAIDARTSETYTLECIQATTGGAISTGLFSLTSASGEDDVESLSISNWATLTTVGRRNLEITLADPSGDVNLGDKWTIAVAGLYRHGTIPSAGTYTGPFDTTYIVACIQGGHMSDPNVAKPVFIITTTTGVDIGGPITWDGSSPISVGSYGVTMNWTWATSLGGEGIVAKGDKFYVDVAAAGEGPIRTAILANNLDSSVVGPTDDLYVDLFIRKNVELGANRTGHAPQKNFEQTDTTITVKAGPITTDSTWVNGTVELDIMKGQLYSQYRGLVQDYTDNVYSLDNISDVETTLGPISQDNPLAYGVYYALLNSAGVEVKFTAVASDDLTGYLGVIDLISDREDVYSLVPLTTDTDVLTAVEGHVNSSSQPEVGRWRIGWVSALLPTETNVVELDDESHVVLATVTDDPSTAGTQYTYVELDATTQGHLSFITAGIKAGDEYRTNYTNDGFGNETYDSYTVDTVLSEDTLRLVAGPASPITVGVKFEIWHPLTKQEQAEYMSAKAASYSDRRVRNVFAPFAKLAGIDQPDMYTCCMLAGLRSGVMPHQGLTNVEIIGIDFINTGYFSKSQLDLMASNGVWLMSQEPITSGGSSGRVFVRHQLTTNTTDINRREDSVTTNVDAMSFGFRDLFRTYIGRRNVTPDILARISAICASQISYYKTIGASTELGSMLIDGQVTSVTQHPTLVDHVIVQINVTLPYPLNGLDIYIVA